MKYSHSSITARIMIVTAVLGWLISLVGLIGIWSIFPRINNSIVNLMSLANRSLDTSIQFLDGIDATLKTTSDTIAQIQSSLVDVSGTFGNTAPLFDSAADMIGKDFSKMADDTRTALVSLASTAKVIDDTLRFISSFPLVGQPYNPPVPLDTSVNNLAASIEKLPANLNEIQSWLDGTGKDLSTLKDDTAKLAISIDMVTPQLKNAVQVMAQYRQLVQDLKNGLSGLETRMTQGLALLAVSLSIFLLWLALAQVSNFTQGLERLHSAQIIANSAVLENVVIEDDLLDKPLN